MRPLTEPAAESTASPSAMIHIDHFLVTILSTRIGSRKTKAQCD